MPKGNGAYRLLLCGSHRSRGSRRASWLGSRCWACWTWRRRRCGWHHTGSNCWRRARSRLENKRDSKITTQLLKSASILKANLHSHGWAWGRLRSSDNRCNSRHSRRRCRRGSSRHGSFRTLHYTSKGHSRWLHRCRGRGNRCDRNGRARCRCCSDWSGGRSWSSSLCTRSRNTDTTNHQWECVFSKCSRAYACAQRPGLPQPLAAVAAAPVVFANASGQFHTEKTYCIGGKKQKTLPVQKQAGIPLQLV
jgi:hypothetical protein